MARAWSRRRSSMDFCFSAPATLPRARPSAMPTRAVRGVRRSWERPGKDGAAQGFGRHPAIRSRARRRRTGSAPGPRPSTEAMVSRASRYSPSSRVPLSTSKPSRPCRSRVPARGRRAREMPGAGLGMATSWRRSRQARTRALVMKGGGWSQVAGSSRRMRRAPRASAREAGRQVWVTSSAVWLPARWLGQFVEGPGPPGPDRGPAPPGCAGRR